MPPIAHVHPGRNCHHADCSEFIYADALCRRHWSEAGGIAAPAQSCGRCGSLPTITQECHSCSERLCSDCYGPWMAIRCSRCKLVAGAGG